MKVIEIPAAPQKMIASYMLKALGELAGRSLTQTTALEALGIIGLRLLVASEAVQLGLLVDEAVGLVEASNEEVSIQGVRDGLKEVFDSKDALELAGIRFHTLQ